MKMSRVGKRMFRKRMKLQAKAGLQARQRRAKAQAMLDHFNSWKIPSKLFPGLF